MNFQLLFLETLKNSALFIVPALTLSFLLRTPLKERLSSASVLLLWTLAFLTLLVPFKVNIPYSINSSQLSFNRSLISNIARLNPEQYIDWGILDSINSNRDIDASRPSGKDNAETLSANRSLYDFLLGLWMAGACGVGFWYGVQHFALKRLLKTSPVCTDGTIRGEINRLLKELHIRKPTQILETESIGTAAIVGLLQPTILISPRLKNCSTNQIHTVLLHELTHYKCGHLWINFLGLLSTLIHWFNPLVWYAYRQLRQSIELACDEAVVSNTRAIIEPEQYAHQLLDLMKQFSSLPNHRLSFLGLFNNLEKPFIRQRILMIKNSKNTKFPLMLVLIAGLCSTAAALTQMTPEVDEPPPPPVPELLPPPPPPVPDNQEEPSDPNDPTSLKETHVDELNLDFEMLTDDAEFSEGAKALLKSVLPQLQGDDPFPVAQMLIDSPYADEPEVQFLIGNIYLQKGYLADAEKFYIRAVNGNPGYKRPLRNLTMIYVTTGHFAEAYPLIRKFLAVSGPDASEAQMNLMAGVCAMDLEQYKEAIPYFKKSIELDPSELSAKLNLFQTYMLLENYGAAVEIQEKVISMETESASLAKYYSYLANAQIGLKRHDLATESLKKVIELDPQNTLAQQTLSEILEKNPILK